MHDRDHARDLAFGGRAAVEEGFDREQNVEILEDTYLELAARDA
jgi:hypothetical protein